MNPVQVVELDRVAHELATRIVFKNHENEMPCPSESDARVERRDSHRCVIAGAPRAEKLRIGSQEIAAEIVDESAGGFAVIADSRVDTAVGEKLLLTNQSVWLEVQVMYLQQISDSQSRLGVMRLRELDETEVVWEETSRLTWTDFKVLMAPLHVLLRPLGAVLGLLLLAPLIVLTLTWILEGSAPLPQERIERTSNFKPSPPAKQSRTPRALKQLDPLVQAIDDAAGPTPHEHRSPSPPFDVKESPIAHRPTEPSAPRAEASTPDAITRSVPPQRLLEPELTKLLGLTQEQLDELRVISDEAQPAISDAPSDRHDVQISRRGLQVLTDQQRDSLLRFLSAQDPADSTPKASSESNPTSSSDGQ